MFGGSGGVLHNGGGDFGGAAILQDDAVEMRRVLGLTAEDPLPSLSAITLSIRALDDSWDPPEGEFDPEMLAQPGVLSNVEKGYGFWGGIGTYIYSWSVPAR